MKKAFGKAPFGMSEKGGMNRGKKKTRQPQKPQK